MASGDYKQDENTKGGGWEDSGTVQRDCIHVDQVAKNPREYALWPRNVYFEEKKDF